MGRTLSTSKPKAVARSPFRGLFPQSSLEDFFEHFLTAGNGQGAELMNAAMDIAETDQAFEVTMDLPGVDADEVDIRIDNNTLTVSGSRTEESTEEDEKRQYHRVERYSGSFSRSVALPGFINEGETAAEYKDGVLKIVVPKREDAKPRKVTIKS